MFGTAAVLDAALLERRPLTIAVLVAAPMAAVLLSSVRGDSVCLTEAPDGSLRLTPTNLEVVRQLEAAQDIIRRYRHTLRELAK
jgi:hypothetical protein